MKKFKCQRCGYCCTLRVKLTFLEYIRLLLLGFKKFSEKNSAGKRCIKMPNNKCFFLSEKDKKPLCIIYSNRPKICKEYPGYKIGLCKNINPAVREYLNLIKKN